LTRRKTKTALRTTVNLDERLVAWIREMVERKIFSDFTHACEFCISQIKMFHEALDELQPLRGLVRILELLKDALDSGNIDAAKAILNLTLSKVTNLRSNGRSSTESKRSGLS